MISFIDKDIIFGIYFQHLRWLCELSGYYFHFIPDLENSISIFGLVRNYEISVRFYDILSGFMNLIYTLKIDFTKLSGFMKSPLHLRLF